MCSSLETIVIEGKTGSKSQIALDRKYRPPPPPVCSFSFLAVVVVFFSRLYIAEVTPIHLKETSIIQAGETGRVLYTQLDTRYSSAAVRLFTAGENTIAAAALRQRRLVL